jgi:Lipase (class 3)
MSFDRATALADALLCQASYAPDAGQQLAALLRIDRADVVSDLDDGHAVYACQTPDATVLVFRGSLSMLDWCSDAEALLADEDHYPGRVHWGFAKVVDKCWPWIVASVPPLKPVFVTGHSLGAATAALAAWRLANCGQHVGRVHTFGGPRIGDGVFSTMYDPAVALYRVVNEIDIVPTLPPALAGYMHAGELVWLDGTGTIGPPSVLAEALRLVRDRGGELARAWECHGIAAYVRALALLRIPEAEMGSAAA